MTEVHPSRSRNPYQSQSTSSSRSLTPELLEYDDYSHLSYSLSSLASTSRSTNQDLTEPEEEEDEDSSEVTVNRPIRASDYLPHPSHNDSAPQNETPPLAAPQTTTVSPFPPSDSTFHFNSDSPPPIQNLERFGSPTSLSSWNPSDLMSYPSSSAPGSSDGDRYLSDHDPEHYTGDAIRNGPLTDGEGEEISDEDGPSRARQADFTIDSNVRSTTHTRTREYLSTITGHLVMPRLPILYPNSHTPSPGSSLRGSSSPRSLSSTSVRRPNGRNVSHDSRIRNLHQRSSQTSLQNRALPSKARVLLLGDDTRTLCTSSGSFGSIPASFNRVDEVVHNFKMCDPPTHEALFSHLSAPFQRLRTLLNPRVFQQITSIESCSQDLSQVIERWVETETYVVVMVEVTQAPISSEALSFFLSLSRLVPILPVISGTVTGTSATNIHAILTRQLVAKRIRHFPIPPVYSASREISFPKFEECIAKSKECFLDWLCVEEAALKVVKQSNEYSGRPHSIRRPMTSHLGLLTSGHEPDRWSEKVGLRVLCLTKESSVISEAESESDQSRSRRTSAPIPVDIFSPRVGLSSHPMGLPSLSCVIRVGLHHFTVNLRQIFRRVIMGVLVSASASSSYPVDRCLSPDPPVTTTVPSTDNPRIRGNASMQSMSYSTVDSTKRAATPASMKGSAQPHSSWIFFAMATAATVCSMWGYSALCG